MGPRFLEIELTGRCALRCPHCYRAAPVSGELPREAIVRILDQAPSRFDCLIFSGGEPFLHPHIVDLARHADKHGFSVHITTSGYKVPRETLSGLPDNVVLVFGVDGIGTVHDRYRGTKGAYEKLLMTIGLWRNRPQEIITTLWKGALNQLEDIVELAERHGAGLHLNALIPVGRAKNNSKILLSRKENEWVQGRIRELKQKHPMIMSDHYKITEKDLRSGIDLFCKGRFSIDPEGSVHPCEFLTSVTFGNIFEETLPAIIQRAKKTPLIQAREKGFIEEVRLDLPDLFDYHTGICHRLARK
jgi:MoaA/NifB/PqqE/SkfB family radical SAM enzyme